MPAAPGAPAPTAKSNVVDLMEALKRSLEGAPKPGEVIRPKKPRKRVEGQREMLLPIAGGAAPQGTAQSAGSKRGVAKTVDAKLPAAAAAKSAADAKKPARRGAGRKAG